MKFKYHVLVMSALFGLIACAPTIKTPVGPDQTAKAKALHNHGEKLFNAKAYADALKVYEEYLDKYPDQPLADEALMKMGIIYGALGRDKAKLDVYQRLVKDYPKSRFVPDAMLGILITYYNKGRFKDVILQAAELLEKTDSKPYIFQTYVYLADTYMAMGSPVDSVYIMNSAYYIAPPEEKEQIRVKLKSAIDRLETKDILFLLTRMDEKLPRGYLLYQMGVRRFQAGRSEEAMKVFSEFIQNFPDHENQAQAREFIASIQQRLGFNRNDIGCLLPISGTYAAFGQRALRGIQLALKIYNSLYGDYPLRLNVQDTESDEQIAVQGVQTLNSQRVSAIIGPMITDSFAAEKAQKLQIPIVVLSQKHGISDLGDYVFRNFLTPQMQIDTIVPYAVEKLGARRFVILYPQGPYGQTFMEIFRDKVTAYGDQVVSADAYNPDQTDFGDIIKNLISQYGELENDPRETGQKAHSQQEDVTLDFDAVFIPDSYSKVGLIAPQLRYYGIEDVLLLGTNLWHSGHLMEMARKYVQGALVPDSFCLNSKKEVVAEFIRRFEDEFNEKPGFFEAIAYDTAMMIFQTVSQPEVKSRKELKDRLLSIRNYNGVTGLTSFKTNGEVDKKLYLLRVKKDKFVEVDE
jgi:branched-chain amino acid transport system substrate-binding protein